MVLEKGQTQAILEAIKIIASDSVPDLDRALSLIIAKGVELTQADVGSVCIIDKTNRYHKLWYKTIFGPESKRNYEFNMNEGITGWVAVNNEPALVPDVNEDGRYVEFFIGTKSELAVPIRFNNIIIGVLNVESSKINNFTEDDQEILLGLAYIAAIAIENAKLDKKIFNNILENLHKIGASITPNLELNPVLREITKGLDAIIEVDIPLIYLYSQEKPNYIDTVYGDISIQWESKCKPRRNGAGAKAIREKKIIFSDENSKTNINPFPKQKGVKTTVAIPLISADSIMGVMYLHYLGEEHHFSDNELKDLDSIIEKITTIFRKNIEEIHSIQKAFHEEDIDRIIYDITKADINLIYHFDQAKTKFGKLLYSSIGKGWEDKSRPRSDGAGALALKERCMVVVYEDTIPGINPVHKNKGIKTTAAIPLILGKKVLGIMYMHFLLKERIFSEEEERAIMAFATNAAIAIETAKSYRDLRMLCDIGEDITADVSLEVVASRIASNIETFAGGGIPNIFLYNNDSKSWRFLACSGAPEELFLGAFAPRKNGIGQLVVDRGKSVIIYDVQNDGRSSPSARNWGIKTTAAFPLRFKGVVLGVLFLHFKQQRFFSEDDEMKLAMFSNKAAIAIENARRYEDLKKAKDARSVSNLIAHKLENPLFAIQNNMQPLLKRIQENRISESEEIISEIIISIETAKAFIEKIKVNSREEEIKFSPMRIKPILEDACALARKYGINCTINCEEDLTVIANFDRLSECFFELVENSNHWFDKQEKIISIIASGTAPIPLPGSLDSRKNYALIRVLDNGRGIPIANKSEIFDPYFSTKKGGSGLGFGLTIVQSIIELHNGAIIETGRYNTGAEFQIYIPLYQAGMNTQSERATEGIR